MNSIFENRQSSLRPARGRVRWGLLLVLAATSVGVAAGLAWRPRAVPLGTGPLQGRVRGVSFAGSSREYVLETPLGTIKAETDAALPAYPLGAEVAFDLPVDSAAPLQVLG